MLTRRKFISHNATLIAGYGLLPGCLASQHAQDIVMTVNGPVKPSELGFTLAHEHVMVDFAGAATTGKHRYNADEVYATALPFLQQAKQLGCKTFVDCTPAYVGRDAQLLQRLAKATGLHILTTTGYYGALQEKFLPQHVFTDTPQQIARRWINEWKNGIEGTGIKPGLIKLGVDKGPLTPAQRKIVEAGAITHLATGLPIGIHTGDGKAAMEEQDILTANGVSLSAHTWIHAQAEKDTAYYIQAAKKGSWISFDAVYPTDLDRYVKAVQLMTREGFLQQVLLSQDSGWYHVGEPKGGEFFHYNTIINELIPLLKKSGITQQEIDLLFITNPAKALTIKIRRR